MDNNRLIRQSSDQDEIYLFKQMISACKTILKQIEPLSNQCIDVEQVNLILLQLADLKKTISQLNLMFTKTIFSTPEFNIACKLFQKHANIIKEVILFSNNLVSQFESNDEKEEVQGEVFQNSQGSYNKLDRKKHTGLSKIVVTFQLQQIMKLSQESDNFKKFNESLDSQNFQVVESGSEPPSQYTWLLDKETDNPFENQVSQDEQNAQSRLKELKDITACIETLEEDRKKIILHQNDKISFDSLPLRVNMSKQEDQSPQVSQRTPNCSLIAKVFLGVLLLGGLSLIFFFLIL